MINDAKAILDRLNSPSDWAVVVGAAVAGLVLDGAINILPMPFFSPGICALVAGSATLSLKRGGEAWMDSRRQSRRTGVLAREAERCLEAYERLGDTTHAEDLRLELELARGDSAAFEKVVRDARSQVGRGRMHLHVPGALFGPRLAEEMTSWFASDPET